MPPPSDPPSSDPALSPARRKFLQRISSLPIKPAARDYYVRWAESWTKALGHHSAERTQAYFDALGRSASIADWQFRQALDAARILACDVLAIPWATSFDWPGLSDQARSLEPDHRTLARESIQVRAVMPAPKSSGPLPATADEIARITDALRRSIRLVGHAYATEETYVYWIKALLRFMTVNAADIELSPCQRASSKGSPTTSPLLMQGTCRTSPLARATSTCQRP